MSISTPKPSITVFNPGGHHNEDVSATADRIIQGATWKKQRIIVILPSAEMVNVKVALSWWNLMMPPNQPVIKYLAQGMEVGDAYSQAIEAIIADPSIGDWEYILTVETDNPPPADGVLKLIEAMDKHPHLDAISGLYYCKGPGGCTQIWGDIKDPLINFRPQPPVPGEIIECYGTGMGFALWRLKMFKDNRIARPLFKTKSSAAEGIGTQDLSFWSEARKYGYRCAVDCSVKVGHMDVSGAFGPAGFIW